MNPPLSDLPPTIPAVVERAARCYGDAAAIIEAGHAISYRSLYQSSRQAASAFLHAGVGAGDVVAIWAPNSALWIIAAIGAQMAGAAITPLNTRLKGREAADIIRRSRAKALVTISSFLGTDYPAMLHDQPLPELQFRLALDSRVSELEPWERFLARGRGAGDPAVDAAIQRLSATDISDILYTSGTTGIPKGVMSEHGRVVKTFDSWCDAVGLRRQDRYLIVNPFFHSFGYKAGWLACLLRGAVILPLATFDIPQLLQIIERERVTVMPGPPTIYQSLLAEPSVREFDLSSLRLAVTGAAVVPPSLIHRMRHELGFETVNTGYGLTEAGVVTQCRETDSVERVSQTCGRAIDGVEICCVDDDGRPVSSGQAGEVLVRGSCVMRGYLDDPAATAEAIDAEGWLHTGDIGVLDEDGYLRITDRKKDVFISGGFNCYPAEIEKLLSAHPQISMVAVVGVPDTRLGEVGKAFIVPRAGAPLSEAEIIQWARANMANYKVPRYVTFVDALPTNAAGKVMRMVLRQL